MKHFPGTPDWVKDAVAKACRRAGVNPDKWTVPLEVIARYESDCDIWPAVGVCKDCRGMMQCSIGQYDSAERMELIDHVNYMNATQAVYVAILYIQSKLDGYGGYGGITKLLKRHDRGPGDVIRAWNLHPRWGVSELRRYYHGY